MTVRYLACLALGYLIGSLSVHLLMQVFAQRVAAQGDNNSFSHFIILTWF